MTEKKQKMSTKRQKFLKKLLFKILFLMVIPLSIIFIFISIYWWTNRLEQINKKFHVKFDAIAYQISSIDNNIENKINKKIKKKSYPKSEIKEEIIKEDKKDSFDTTYYTFLFNQMIVDFGMAEIDSITIDSLVKIEMKNRLNIENQNIDKTEISDKSQSLKKDELLKVKSLKPSYSGNNNLSEVDSLIFESKSSINYTIEFWKTPLRTQGIKSIGNLIIIYGIDDFDNTSLIIDNKLRLVFVYKNNSYIIKPDGKLYSFRELQLK